MAGSARYGPGLWAGRSRDVICGPPASEFGPHGSMGSTGLVGLDALGDRPSQALGVRLLRAASVMLRG